MPVLPTDSSQSNLTDKVAKESPESTASSHPLHQEGQDKESGGKGKLASAMDHLAHPGPAISDNLGKPASKEELHARSEELNKK
ncbi:hypothetical protein EJ06DRAFT_578941 [Trichodelitschia bisporula]|uniref:Uncharacterized protein n=1 Tax=Trichodelitschia bisporula TaxID=703511 RepID=A0A6G1I7K3_9PEZI|nr:hypothetical protein EJ06DRAFT_578941 [Trichodelitschia bisporula]